MRAHGLRLGNNFAKRLAAYLLNWRCPSILVLIMLAPGVPQVAAAEPPTAADLLHRFERQLLFDPPSADVVDIGRELARLRAAEVPVVRLQQSSSWNFGEVADLGLGGTVTALLSHPEGEAQEALMAQRLLLARHNARSERRHRVREFRRMLRLLAHLEEVEALLAGLRSRLLARQPQWLRLERDLFGKQRFGIDPATAVHARSDGSAAGLATAARLADAQIGYLEAVQALERTRGERYVLARSIEVRAGLEPLELEGVNLGRPPLPAAGRALQCGVNESVNEGANETVTSDETIRAGLLLEEARLATRAEAARTRPQVSLELSGSAHYRTSHSVRDPRSRDWRGDLSASLRVLLPATAGVSGEARLRAGPNGLNQELALNWPPRRSPRGSAPEESAAGAEADYREALAEARLAAIRAQRALLDARGRLKLRVLELSRVRASLASSGGDLGSVKAAAQAELGLLNAQLEVDLARIEVGASCDLTPSPPPPPA